MKNNIPTIAEINALFIPIQFREYFEIIEITPTDILLYVKKTGSRKEVDFFKTLFQISKMIGIEIKLQTR
jgi:hypothetical protein